MSRAVHWRIGAVVIGAVVFAPLAVVFASFLRPDDGVWRHLVDTLLAELLVNTAWLVAGVGLGTVVLGISLAWLVAAFDFPLRKFFDWALMLPLALPAYVIAFVAIGLFDFTGPVQTMLRAWLGAERLWFPPIRSTGGVIGVMTLALYPYVYLLARNAFLTQGRRGLEVAQSLGHDRLGGFFRVSLPMARPWIVGGVSLVLMETLADFGAVSVFNYDTFTTAIYKAWFSLFSLPAAAQLSSVLVLMVFILLVVEQRVRANMRYAPAGRGAITGDRVRLNRRAGWLACGYCAGILLVAFVLPVLQIGVWAVSVMERDLDGRYLAFLSHSVVLAAGAAVLCSGCAVILIYATRHGAALWLWLVTRVATMGYALPGTVLAVGIFMLLTWMDRRIIESASALFGVQTGPLLTGTVAAMLLAYTIRFLAVAHNPIESAIQRITQSVDEAAYSLGAGGMRLFRAVHFPMIKGGLLTGLILVFVDVMKEMPITLMTRPFGWDTLSVRIFEMTSEGEWERAALPAAVLVLVGLLPVVLVARHSRPEG